MPRKTIPVEDVKKAANDMLAKSVDDKSEGRIAIGVLLEKILHDTGNCYGFRYLEGHRDENGDFHTGDETRRHYF